LAKGREIFKEKNRLPKIDHGKRWPILGITTKTGRRLRREMPLTVLNHALADHIVTRLRDENTPPEQFRPLTRALTHILIAEATKNLPTRPRVIRTPLEEMEGRELGVEIVAVPVLRAGLGMLEPTLEMLPGAAVGYVGLERDEVTAEAHSYYCKLPNMAGKTAFLLDPMLATGGSAYRAAKSLYEAGAERVILLCVVAAPQGIARLEEAFPALQIVAAARDRDLNAKSFILPGLGDFGDRLYGTF
jgi:uracil phosphoribosyltransferase